MTGEGATTDSALRGFVGYNIKRAFSAIQMDLARSLRPFELRMMTFSALSIIAARPNIRLSHLAEALSVERPNLVVIVDELESRALILRVQTPEDRRAYALTITLKGRRLLDRATLAVAGHEARMLAGVTAADRAALLRALGAIETAAQTTDHKTTPQPGSAQR